MGAPFSIAAASAAPALLTACRLTVTQYVGMSAEFAALAKEASVPNPHFSPASIAAAATTMPDDEIVIIASRDTFGVLKGIWAFQQWRGAGSLGFSVLRSPLVPLYEVLSAPVLDRNCAGQALNAMLAFIAASPELPSVIAARSLPMEGGDHAALMSCLGAPSWRIVPLETWQRGIALANPAETPEGAIRRALGASFKKRMTQRRALEKLGAVTFALHTRNAAAPAFERFVALEARGWKGRRRSALVHRPDDAAWMRACVDQLATCDGIVVGQLDLDGEPIAMGIVFREAGTAVYMKTAFAESHARYSPGLHLEIELTRALLAQGQLTCFDCGGDDHVNANAHIWPERRSMGHAMIMLDTRWPSRLAVLGATARSALRRLRDRLRGA